MRSRMAWKSGSRSVPSTPCSVRGPPGPGVGEEDGEVDLVLVGVEVEEELLHLVDHLVDAGVGPVHLVDHQHDREPGLEGLAQHEAGLGEGSLRGVDQQEDAVDHGQAPLDLAAEVGVAGGVDDVDLDPVVDDGGVLGQDGDALLPLEITRVHDPLVDRLVGPERPRLPEHGVDQGGLAVVDVGHDGHVADVVAGQEGHGRVEAIGRDGWVRTRMALGSVRTSERRHRHGRSPMSDQTVTLRGGGVSSGWRGCLGRSFRSCTVRRAGPVITEWCRPARRWRCCWERYWTGLLVVGRVAGRRWRR